MKPVLPTPAEIAKKRYTSKTRIQRNIDMVQGFKAANQSQQNALLYLAQGFAISTSTGKLLDGWGERFNIARAGRSDDEYRIVLQQATASSSVSMQSRTAIGSYLRQVYGLQWLNAAFIGAPNGAFGSALNRVPFRMVLFHSVTPTPEMVLPQDLASATLAIDVYTAAQPPSVQVRNAAALFPGNLFSCFWGGLEYQRTVQTIRADTTTALRVRGLQSISTRINNTATLPEHTVIIPHNSLCTVKRMEIQNG